MRLELSQGMRTLQTQILAPRMIQSMEILQLPLMALEERVRQEAEQNPLIELTSSTIEQTATDFDATYRHEAADDPGMIGGSEGAIVADQIAGPGEPTLREELKNGISDQEFAAFEHLVAETGDDFRLDHVPSRWAGMEMSDKKQDAMMNMADRRSSLASHLLDQLALTDAKPTVRAFAEYLISQLDHRGFLTSSLSSLAAQFEIPLTNEEAEDALDLIHDMEPTGVGARDLAECLLLQLDDPPEEIEHVDVLRIIIERHLDDILHNRLPVIERKTHFDVETLREAIREMRVLDPAPGSKFAESAPQYIVPDMRVELDENGEWVLRMNEEALPNVQLSRSYVDMLKEKKDDPKALEYVKRKMLAARWLMEAIQQRRATLEKVTRAIIDYQKEFLDKGEEFIEPLKMQQIADRVGVHVTTVSRAVDDKWIETPRGVYSLKSFFGGGTVNAQGQEIAFETIKRRLLEIIAKEDKSQPYSDEDLEQELATAGYPVKRRTITKYRKELGILSSRQRKQH